MLGTIVYLIFVIALIIFCVKGLMWPATLLLMIQYGCVSMVVGLIHAFAMPKGAILNGPPMPVIPYIVGALLFLIGVIGVFFRKGRPVEETDKPSPVRWVCLVIGIILMMTGLILALTSIFSPVMFASETPVPRTGVMLFLVFLSAGSISLYAASRFNSSARPNLMRWIIFFFVFVFINVPSVISLILIFAMPLSPQVVYPYESSIATLGYLPLALLLLAMTREYGKAEAISPPLPDEDWYVTDTGVGPI